MPNILQQLCYFVSEFLMSIYKEKKEEGMGEKRESDKENFPIYYYSR